MNGADSVRSRTKRAREVLDRIRNEPLVHVSAVAVAAVIGLVVASIHWFGLLLGGALLGLVAPTLRRAVANGVAFGAVVLFVFALTLGSSAWALLEMTPIVYITVGSAFGLPVFGSLVRGVV
ncbi:hypothetical protein [Halostagnicola bangensis]